MKYLQAASIVILLTIVFFTSPGAQAVPDYSKYELNCHGNIGKKSVSDPHGTVDSVSIIFTKKDYQTYQGRAKKDFATFGVTVRIKLDAGSATPESIEYTLFDTASSFQMYTEGLAGYWPNMRVLTASGQYLLAEARGEEFAEAYVSCTIKKTE